jgi:hypothetical protein
MSAPVQPQQPRKKDNTTLIILLAVGAFLLFQALPFLLVIGIYILIALAGGGVFGFIYFFTPGEVSMHCLEGENSWVTIDDEEREVCISGHTATYELERGPHTVRIEGQKTRDRIVHMIEIKGGLHHLVVPAHENQCFVQLDMTDVQYRAVYKKGVGPPSPEIVDTYGPGEPFDRPSSTYMSEEELPEYLGDEGQAYLLLDLPCDVLEKPQDEILTHLGY